MGTVDVGDPPARRDVRLAQGRQAEPGRDVVRTQHGSAQNRLVGSGQLLPAAGERTARTESGQLFVQSGQAGADLLPGPRVFLDVHP